MTIRNCMVFEIIGQSSMADYNFAFFGIKSYLKHPTPFNKVFENMVPFFCLLIRVSMLIICSSFTLAVQKRGMKSVYIKKHETFEKCIFLPAQLNLFLLFNRGSSSRKAKILTTAVAVRVKNYYFLRSLKTPFHSPLGGSL